MRFVCSILTLVSLSAAPLASQVALAAATEARGAPGGSVVLSLRAGAVVTAGATKGQDVLVTIEGWVDASRLGGKRDSFPASVAGTASLRLRAAPSLQGAIVGELKPGAGLAPVGKQGTWTRVRRSAWIAASALPQVVARAQETKQPTSADSALPAPAGSLSATRATKVLASPGGRSLGDLAAGAVIQPLAREHGWTRVRVEGWVSERDLAPADSSFGAALGAADLRADPEGTRGKVVRWEVQVLSLQTADPLRTDMARDEPYLLARGPASENALLYLAVPPSLLNEVKAIPPLTRVIITARVRAGRSEPVGTPLLDLRTIARR
ncbi:MAG: SH3 domain-containing protein [Gemmatimonadales bacterium]